MVTFAREQQFKGRRAFRAAIDAAIQGSDRC
jgi:hypothetical protein